MNIIVAVLILGFIIIVHELGHFLLAKKNGVTVTEFSVGMGPRIASFEKNGTRYSLKLLPFGGSCLMLGEDENIEDEGAFNKKGVWARFSILFAGAFFNFLLAFFLSLIVLGTDGVDIPDIIGVNEGSPAEEAGMQVGDQIIKIDGTPIHFSREIMYHFYFEPLTEKPIEVTYLRDGKKHTTSITPNTISRYLLGCHYNPTDGPAELVEVGADYPLGQAGVVVGDIITGIDGTKINSGKQLSEYLDANPLSEKPISITYMHNGEENTVTITPQLYTSGYQLGWQYNYKTDKVSPLNVIKYSFYELKFNIVSTIKSVGFLIGGKVGVDEIAGPVGIVNMVGDAVDLSKEYGIGTTLLTLAEFTILISANLGVMNLLPIPALDGGRLVFLLIEAIRRKPISKDKEAIVHLVGMAALMLLMVFVLFNDIKNIFG
ncbi:MAG: PDZ domain-containing protein [Clostridiales bacterium]|nr:PDZ domain-containing protein [Clostridiales bacterium]